MNPTDLPANLQFTPTGRLMIGAFARFETILLDHLHQAGFADLTVSHFNVMRHLDPGGLNMVDLAREAAISKQAISKIAADLKDKGYVDLTPSTRDRRAKEVVYTPRGEAAVQTAVEIVKHIEKHYLALLGSTRYHALRDDLVKMHSLTQELT